MNLRQLECFIAVAQHLNFTRAAEELGMAQPPLSQHVRKLEAEFGVVLFTRSKHHVELTEVGRAFLPRAKSLVYQAEVARYEVMEMAGLKRGHLRVGASGTIAAFFLPDVLTAYRSKYPNISLHIVQHRSETILGMVEAGELDIGLLRLPLKDTSLEVTKIGSEPLYAALPPNHRLAQQSTISLGCLHDEPFVMCVDKREPFYSVVSTLCASEGFIPNVICAGAEYTTVFRLVGMGMGVSISSELATNLRVEPSPVFTRLDNPDAIITSVMVAGPKNARSSAAQAFYATVLRERERRAEGFSHSLTDEV
jgi:DNA-binding transcriptional LysR family regulator